MALPALNNKTAMGNLSLDDKSQILTSLVQSGKLQLANYGAINFNQNITQMGATATKEGGSNAFGEGVVRVLNQIKGILFDLNNSMLRYVESNVTSQQVTQNLLEAKAKDIEVKREDGSGFIGKDNAEKFYKVFESMESGIKSLVGDVSKIGTGGMFGTGKGFLGNLLSSLIPKLLKGFLFGAAGVGIYKIIDKIDDGEINGSPMKKLNKFVKDSLGIDFSEEGENQDQGDTATSTGGRSTPTPTGEGTRNPANPFGGPTPGFAPQQPQTTATPTTGTTSSPRTATPTKNIITNRGDIASDSDLIGIKFAQRKNNPDKNIVKGLAKTLQYIRKKLGGKTLFVNSGFRTLQHNREVGGEKGSFHMRGWAADVSKQSIGSKKDQILFVKYAVEAGIGGIGFYDTFIHIDIRPRKGGRISRWNVNKFPKEALDIINNPGKYQIDESLATISAETTAVHKEENENSDSGTSAQTTTEATAPKNASVGATPTQKTKEIAQPEQGTTASPEYEDEQEEAGEKVLTESTTKVATLDLKEKSAIKESANTSNEKKVFDFFVSKGFTKEQSAGIAGSLKGESQNFDANQKQQGGGPGRGIAQWEGSRLKELKERKGNNWNTLKGQLEFIYEEITGATKDKSYKKVFNLIKSAKTAKEAAKIWTEKYEKPSKPKLQQRMVYAETIYKKYTNDSTEIAQKDQKQPTTTADNSTTSKNPKLDTKNGGQTTEQPTTEPNNTANSTQPEQPEVVEESKTAAEKIADDVTANIEEFGEKIKNLKPGELKASIDEELFGYTEKLGKGLGLDTSRLKKLPKHEQEETITTAKLTPEVSESAGKRIEETTKTNLIKKEETSDDQIRKMAKEFFKPEQQQQPIVNVSAGGGGGSENSPVAGGISQMDVRDSVLHQMQYRKGSTAPLV